MRVPGTGASRVGGVSADRFVVDEPRRTEADGQRQERRLAVLAGNAVHGELDGLRAGLAEAEEVSRRVLDG